jgi:hypothetical protein
MKNKEQLLYFFLGGKISLSQYDYKFMANLQTMIQNNSRVTSNQAELFTKLISKYSKQLTKSGLVKEELKSLPWKTLIVESTSEYTGAAVRIMDDNIIIRVPFNKTFIAQFRSVEDNSFVWDKEEKLYRTKFDTRSLKLAHTVLPKFFPSVRYCDTLQQILDDLEEYKNLVWNPTVKQINDKMLLVAGNDVLGSIITDADLTVTPNNLFKLSRMGISIDPKIYENNEKLKFAASKFYTTDVNEYETTISWMKNVGCEHVILGRGIRSVSWRTELAELIEKYGMKVCSAIQYGSTIEGVVMLMQHVSNTDNRSVSDLISKTIVITDSRPIEVL